MNIFFKNTIPALFSLVLLIASNTCFAQKVDIKNPFECTSFIENKGQFAHVVKKQKEEIAYGLNSNGVEMYFTTSGMYYKHSTWVQQKDKKEKDEKEQGKSEERENIVMKEEVYFVKMQWQHANKEVQLIAENKQEEYYTYSNPENKQQTIKANAYKKITYKNLYDGIDVEYTFPENKEGIKYTFIVHAGADVSKIKMKYSNADELELNAENNLIIKTPFGNITDHKPFSYLENSKKEEVKSAFTLQNNEITFTLDNYDKSQTLIIDPWTVNPAFPSINKAYDIEKDGLGNIYIYGGQNPYLLKKYTPAGAPIWTYTTTFTGWYGDLAVEPTGISYISQGYNASNANPDIAKVDPAGVVVYNVSGPAGQLEYWALNFNCGFSQLTISGGVGTGNISFINLATGAANTTTSMGSSESRGMSKAVNGNYYSLTHTTGNLVAIDPSFVNIYTVATGYSFAYSIPSYNTSFGSPDAGYNCIVATNNHIYTTNSLTVNKWNINTGAAMANATLPAGVLTGSGGIVQDGCGNVYVGGTGAVYKYDSNLVLLSTFVTTGEVYGLCLNLATAEVLACGNGFLKTVDTLSCITSSVGTLNLQATTYCPDSAKVTITNANPLLGYTFLWQDSTTGATIQNVLQPVGVNSNTATGLTQGVTYKVTVIQSTNCQVVSNIIYLNIGCSSINVSLCPGAGYTLSTGAIITTPGVYYDTLTNISGSDSIVTITLANYPTYAQTVNASICPSQSYTLPNGAVVSAAGTYTSNFTTIHGCDSIITTILTIKPNTSSTQNAVICNNTTYTLPSGIVVSAPGTYVSTIANAAGCDSVITTILTNNVTTSSSTTVNICANKQYILPNGTIVSTAGIYVTTLTNAAGCDSVITTTVQVKPISTKTVNVTICQGKSYTLPNGTIVTTAGTYVNTFTAINGCDSIITTIVTQPPAPVSNINVTICETDTYTLIGGKVVNTAGIYTDTLSTMNGCDSLVITTLNVSKVPTINLGPDTTACINNTIVLDINTGIANAQYLWNDNTILPIKSVTTPGTYTATITVPPCPSVTDSKIIDFVACSCTMLIPNAFSPNDDDKNDNFKPSFYCNVPIQKYLMQIFNRWGQEIYATQYIDNSWDGKLQGVNQEIGTYYYLIKYTNPKTNKDEVLKGDITLVR